MLWLKRFFLRKLSNDQGLLPLSHSKTHTDTQTVDIMFGFSVEWSIWGIIRVERECILQKKQCILSPWVPLFVGIDRCSRPWWLPTCATVPCISWKTPKRNLCHLDWTFNIRTLNWTFTYGIGLEEENKFKFQFWTCHVQTIKPILWVYSNGLWSYHKLSVLKKNIPAFRTYPPPPPSFPPAEKRHVVW